MRRRAWAAALALLGAGPAAAAGGVDLEGTWHVLVHYQDRQTAHPEAWRWEDHVWVIERQGSRLRWTDYPIVVFQDDTGRFEARGGNPNARVLEAWEPNEGQLRQIREGLEINERGSKRKTLTGSDATGWRSAAGRAPQAYNVLTYSEIWSIEDAATLPVFSRDESLGGALSESLEGRTVWRTEAVEEAGAVLRGLYDRDGARLGRFRMQRAASVSQVKGSGKTQGQRVQELFFRQLGADPALAEVLGAARAEAEEEALRAEVRRGLERSMREQDLDPRLFRSEVERMVEQIVRELRAGRSPEEVRRMVRDGEIRPDPPAR